MTRRGWVLLIAVGVIWGTPYLLIKIAVGEVSPAMVVFARTAIGALVLAPFALRAGGLAALRGRWRYAAAFAVLGMMAPWYLIASAERSIASSTAGLLIALVPTIAVVTGRIAGDRLPVAPIRWLGLLVGLAGVVLLTGPVATGADSWAVAQMLLAAVGYATGPILVERTLRDAPAVTLTAVCLGLTALAFLPVVLVQGVPAEVSTDGVLALVALGVLGTAVAYVLALRLIAEVGGARTTLVTYLNPLVAVLLGALVLGEPVTVAVVGGAALILGGSALASRRAPHTVRSHRLERRTRTRTTRPRPRG